MWAKIAEDLGAPWRAVEAMHWQLGEIDMAHRAGVMPFSLAVVNDSTSAACHTLPFRATCPNNTSIKVPHINCEGSQLSPAPLLADSFTAHALVQERRDLANSQVPMGLPPILTEPEPVSTQTLPSIEELPMPLSHVQSASSRSEQSWRHDTPAYNAFSPLLHSC